MIATLLLRWWRGRASQKRKSLSKLIKKVIVDGFRLGVKLRLGAGDWGSGIEGWGLGKGSDLTRILVLENSGYLG
jgi:hypothetical protein